MSTPFSPDSAATPPTKNNGQTWQQRSADYWRRRGLLELWTGVIGNRSLENEQDSQRKNRDAEESHVRRNVWGVTDETTEADDMGNTILGDVTNPTPVVVAGSTGGSGLASILAGTALGVLIPVAGVGGYLLSQLQSPEPVPATDPGDDNTIDLGLGRVSDYLDKIGEAAP